MRSLFWKDGRFAWPPIVAAAIIVAAALAADYVWRVSDMPGSKVLGVCGLAALAALMALYFSAWRRRP